MEARIELSKSLIQTLCADRVGAAKHATRAPGTTTAHSNAADLYGHRRINFSDNV